MTSTADVVDDEASEASEDEEVTAGPRPGALLLVVASAVAAVVVAAALGFAWGNHSGAGTAATPGVNSVDAGFARDMSVHHQQAVTMAAYARDNSTDPEITTIAFDIESSQSVEMGRMIGWLDGWGVSRTSGTAMAWMGHADDVHDGLMPGMATAQQMTTLLSSHGKALDILFLQLMIRHHQGGIAMAQYAELHAKVDYVRTLAGQMYATQTGEITTMEQMLRQLGGTPLPPPAD